MSATGDLTNRPGHVLHLGIDLHSRFSTVLTGRRLGDQPDSTRSKTPSTPRRSIPIRFPNCVAETGPTTCGFAEFPSKWRTGFSYLCGGSYNRTVVQHSPPRQRGRSALGRQYAAWAIGAVGASVGAGAPLRRKVVGLADVPHAQAEISHLFFSVPSVVHAQGIRASSVRLSGLASRCSAPSPMPALARRQGAIQAIGRIYRSCVFNGGDQPIGELARRWKTIASWRSRCRNSTTCRSLLKS
jgi:hypothetical protein